MSSAKVHVVIHDNAGGWSERPMPGISMHSFFGYVLGNPEVRASGRTEQEVLDRIRDLLLVGLDPDHPVKRKIVELDLGDHVLASDVMHG